MTHPAEARCVALAGETSGGQARLGATEVQVEVGGRTIDLPVPPTDRDWEKLDFRRGFPGRARGDQRETLLAAAIQDASPSGGVLPPDDELLEALSRPGVLPAADAQTRAVVAEVIGDQYWISPHRGGGRTGAGRRPALFPLHAALPLNFKQRGRYKMYRGDILLFLAWDGRDFDPEPIEKLFELMNSEDELSLLDELLIDSAVSAAGKTGIRQADPQLLLTGDQAAKVRASLSDGAYLPRNLARFREDLLTVLAMPLPRHDKVSSVILTMSLHLALYYYEVAFNLGQDLDHVVVAAAGAPTVARKDFSGALRFRVGTAGDRPIQRVAGCAEAWRELDNRYLIALSANIITSNLLHDVWSAAGGAPAYADPGMLAAEMRSDGAFCTLVDAAARAQAVLFAARAGEGASTEELEAIGRTECGVHALRQTVLRHRTRTLKHLSRDVVNQLVKPAGYGGTLVRTRGNVQFFELDETFLFLLVRFVIVRHGAGDPEIPFTEFLRGLAEYGLAPQDDEEGKLLTGALERLGMLHRYSDAGEATYVRHLL